MKLILITLLLGIHLSCFCQTTAICTNGKPACVLITPVNSNKLESLAARELAKYLEEITRIRYQVVSESEVSKIKEAKTCIYLSAKNSSSVVNKYIPANYYKGLKLGGYILFTTADKGKNYILISGANPKAVLNGVYGFVEEILKQESGHSFVDIDFKLDKVVKSLSVKPLNLVVNPYCTVNGIELDGLGLDNKTLLEPAAGDYMSSSWKGLVDWARRHKMNFISNWPYGGESMNDFPNIVTLDSGKYPKPISKFSVAEIQKAAAKRKELLKYASDNGIDPYLMTYVPGWFTSSIKTNYPQFCGVGSHGDADGFGSKAFNWGSEEVHAFMADLSKAVAQQYPEAKGIHLRVWGGESAPDVANKDRKAELIQKIIKGMVASATTARPDLKFIISEYTDFQDNDLTYLPQLKAINPNLILTRKWDEDWGVSNDPKIPSKPLWLNAKDGVLRAVSHSIPNEEAIPFWFPSAKLYQEGILKYVKPNEETIGGWPINYREWHTNNCDNVLNLLAITKLSWDPFSFDYQKFYADSYYFLFGSKEAANITKASELCSRAMSNFLYDYGGIVDGMDSKNWQNLTKALIGKPQKDKWSRKIAHILDKENQPEVLEKIKKRLESVVPEQVQAAHLLLLADPNVSKNREMFENMLHVNQIWVCILKSRLAAVNFILNKKDPQKKKLFFDEVIAMDKEMASLVAKLTNTSAQSMHDVTDSIKAGFIRDLTEEQDYLIQNYNQ